MKKNFTLLFLAVISLAFSQAGAPAAPYYNGFNWALTGMSLKNSLATKITTTHTNLIPYVWDATQATDLDPLDSNNVFLIYGFSNNICPSSISDGDDHRKRNVNSNGGGNSCEWNREHVYARALGTPPLDQGGVSDAGEDAHNLRASDVDRNGNRGNLKFAPGNGNRHYRDLHAATRRSPVAHRSRTRSGARCGCDWRNDHRPEGFVC